MKNFIRVTRPSLPQIDKYFKLAKKIWSTGILTHNGPYVREFEKKLKKILGVKNLSTVANGTLAIQLAIKSLDLKGEIITTPFTWIATIDAIIWEKCKPIFVDVEIDTFNIDTNLIEKKINKNTVAILGVHTFSNPCNVQKINKIAKNHNIKVIYDAAHSMFVNYKKKSILSYGDLSATSLHATKILNSVEGGACISKNNFLDKKIKSLRFFGFDDKGSIENFGTNAKMTEMHAIMGILNLKNIKKVLSERKRQYLMYFNLLKNNQFLSFQSFDKDSYNYSYMPIIVNSNKKLKNIIQLLNDNNYFPRRYFYPSLNKLKKIAVKQKFVNSEYLAERILCLPLYYGLEDRHIKKICKLINEK